MLSAVKRWLPPAVALLLATLGILWWYQPERVIERRSRALLETITVPPSASKASRMLRPESLAAFLAPSVIFHTRTKEVNGTLERDDVVDGFRYLATNASETSFQPASVLGVEVTGDDASIRLLVDARAVMSGREPLNGEHDVTLTWRKSGSSWLLTQVDFVPVGDR